MTRVAADPRRFSLNEVVRKDVVTDAKALEAALQRLGREVLSSIERQAHVQLTDLGFSVAAERMLSGTPLPQSWWEWLLRQPRRYPKPLFVLTVSCLAVPKKEVPADAR